VEIRRGGNGGFGVLLEFALQGIPARSREGFVRLGAKPLCTPLGARQGTCSDTRDSARYDSDAATRAPPHVPDLTLAQIQKDIANAPPMRREIVAGQYIGIRVDWLAYLRTAYERDGKIRVRLSSKLRGTSDVLCDIDPDAYPQFRILHEHAPLRVSGVIDSWFIGDAVLKDVRFTFLPHETP
jgi:hypothetical protein